MQDKIASKASAFRGRTFLRIVLALILTAAAGWIIAFHDVRLVFLSILTWIESSGPLGPLIFFVLYLIAGVLMLPGLIFTIGAGLVFGVVKGSLVVYFSATASATAAFLVGRYLVRDWVRSKLVGNRVFESLDQAVGREGWKIVGLTRLSPVFPYNILNYAFGLTRVSLKDYVLASFFGMIPVTTAYVYLGSLAGSLAEIGVSPGGAARSTVEWIIYILGGLATIAVVVVVTRISRRALKERVG